MADGWSEYPHDWDERRHAVYQRDGHQCQKCGRRGGVAGDVELHCHHIVPKSKGGSHDTSNLVTLCRDCHNKEHDHHIQKMSNVNNGSRNQNAGLDDWRTSTQASEHLQDIANDHFDPETSKSPSEVGTDTVSETNSENKTTSEPEHPFTETEIKGIVVFSYVYLGALVIAFLVGGFGFLIDINKLLAVSAITLIFIKKIPSIVSYISNEY